MPIHANVVIIGAGPAGLFQVFELGLLDIHAHVVDALPRVGGQCAELYPEKPIYDIPAFPVIDAQELVDRLVQQIKPFKAEFYLSQTVTELKRRSDGRFTLRTSAGTEFDTACVIIAAGLGAFQPRKLRTPGAADFEGRNVHYRIKQPENFAGKDILILGGGDSALDWTLELQDKVRSLTLVHRRPDYRAQPTSVKKMKALAKTGAIREFQGMAREIMVEDGVFGGLRVADEEDTMHDIHADHVCVFWGLTPNLGPIADWGLDIEKRQVLVDTEKFQTSERGIFAVGDINTYPGKKKLILSGFHEAALAAFAVRQHLEPDKRVFLQYTTTSPIMHRRLGLEEDEK
ncbi:MAG: NAD(P)/FAD-dependent oxidoreductase [Xanthomonadales bacterium]|nr:NAD(P)/FAD-dependent oxidoreductase [Xanthomonadales bacterium]